VSYSPALTASIQESAEYPSGQSVLMRKPSACETFYRSNRLAWPYDGAGRFVGSGRAV